MKNPILNEFFRLNLISKSNLIAINKKTRDKPIKVLKDIKTKIILLEKNLTSEDYYSTLKSKDDNRKTLEKAKSKISFVKTFSGNIKTSKIDDDTRRVIQFKQMVKNKDLLDFGCGWGGYLDKVKNAKSLSGIEIRKECLNFLKKKNKKFRVSNEFSYFSKNFDIITMFHVLEHSPYQVKILKSLKSKLNPKGKIIIEVPHAEDFLILQDELQEFKDFHFWSEHLVLHTKNSLKYVLKKAGFKKIKVYYYQRYNFSNHLGWFLNRKPGGHNLYKKNINKNLNEAYCENLKKLGQTDTLIAIAE